MKLDTKCNEIDDTGTRLNKYIRYFGKEMASDKLTMMMVIMILLSLVLLVLAIALPDKSIPAAANVEVNVAPIWIKISSRVNVQDNQ